MDRASKGTFLFYFTIMAKYYLLPTVPLRSISLITVSGAVSKQSSSTVDLVRKSRTKTSALSLPRNFLAFLTVPFRVAWIGNSRALILRKWFLTTSVLTRSRWIALRNLWSTNAAWWQRLNTQRLGYTKTIAIIARSLGASRSLTVPSRKPWTSW